MATRQGLTSSKPPIDRLPPHSIEAEQGVLGCIMQAPDECLEHTTEYFRAGAAVFYDLRHRTIYQRLVEMWQGKKHIDLITVHQWLRDRQELDAVGGLAYLSTLPEATPSASNVAYYTEIVREKYLLRCALATAANAVSRIYDSTDKVDDILNKVEQAFMELRVDDEVADNPVMDATQCSVGFMHDMDDRITNSKQGKRSGFRTGFDDLDETLDGLQLKEMTVVAARPSVGKTAFACNLVKRLCFDGGIPTLFVSCEMSAQALSRRLCSLHSEVPMRCLRSGNIDASDERLTSDFLVMLSQKPYYVVNGMRGLNCEQLHSITRRMVRKHGIRFVVLDYLQKVRSVRRHEKRTYEIGEVSAACKAIAEDCGVAFLVLAQLNREPTKEKERLPRMSDLADSGQIERDADNILLLHRDSSKQENAMVIIAKQRDGESGLVHLQFQGAFCKFLNPPKKDSE